MIYTCYDMIRDCRAGRPEGWSYFASNYVPVIRRILAHYAPDRAPALLRPVLDEIRRPQSNLFSSLDPAPERWFVAELRRHVLDAVDKFEAPEEPSHTVALETLSEALAPLTVVEKQAAWMETMRYTPSETGTLLRMEPRTVEKIRAKAAELLRAKMDAWSQSILAANGRQLGLAAAAGPAGADCLPAKSFLEILDGRANWDSRESMERHVGACWHCIDHFCRMVEVVELLRGIQPLSESETSEFLGVAPKKKPAWKRLFGAT